MRRARVLFAAVLVLLCAAGGTLAAQEAAGGPRLFFGPRLGASGVVILPDAFNATMQALYPDPSKQYFPAFTEMGVQATQLVPLGESKSYLSFQEMLLLGALDQSMPLLGANATIAYRTASGFEVGFGPYFTTVAPGGALQLTASVVYAVGWTIAAKGFSVPITLMFVPLPSYVNPRISLLFGFLFEAME